MTIEDGGGGKCASALQHIATSPHRGCDFEKYLGNWLHISCSHSLSHWKL